MTTSTHETDRIEKARPKQLRLAIIDDHPIVRRGLREALEQERGFRVVGEAADDQQAIELIRREQPDLAIVDLSLGSVSGLELIRRLRAEAPSMRILVFSIHDEALYAERSLRAGADGYLGKSESPDRLIDAVRSTLGGETVLSPEMTDRLVRRAVGGGQSSRSGIEQLSNRELEVFQLIGNGLGTRRVAANLHISVKTVETHRENIKRKLGVADASELVRHAVAWVEHSA